MKRLKEHCRTLNKHTYKSIIVYLNKDSKFLSNSDDGLFSYKLIDSALEKIINGEELSDIKHEIHKSEFIDQIMNLCINYEPKTLVKHAGSIDKKLFDKIAKIASKKFLWLSKNHNGSTPNILVKEALIKVLERERYPNVTHKMPIIGFVNKIVDLPKSIISSMVSHEYKKILDNPEIQIIDDDIDLMLYLDQNESNALDSSWLNPSRDTPETIELLDEFYKDLRDRVSSYHQRQQPRLTQVFDLIFQGKKSIEISEHLKVSNATVCIDKKHIQKITSEACHQFEIY